MKTKKLKDLHQTHGMVEKFKPTTIDQVLGGRNASYTFLKDPFSEEEYNSYLRALTSSELRAHCETHGFIFNDNRGLVERKLMTAFRENRAKYKMPLSGPTQNKNINYDKVSKIMAGGR